MRTLVKSLKRLYQKGKVSKEKIRSMEIGGKITHGEYEHIVNLN